MHYSIKPKSKLDYMKRPAEIKLEKKIMENVTPSYYAYVDEDGEEHKFTGIVTLSNQKAVGKIMTSHKVILEDHPAIEHIKHVPEHYTYIGDDGEQHVYNGPVQFDEERSTYIGTIKEYGVTNTVIDIFEEK